MSFDNHKKNKKINLYKMQKSSLILFETIKWSHSTQPINHENVQIFLVKIIQILTKEKYFPQCVPCYV